MATWDGELLEKVFSVFAKKNKNGNLGWGTLEDAIAASSVYFGQPGPERFFRWG